MASTALASWPPAAWQDDRTMGFYSAPIADADEEERAQKIAFWRATFLAYRRHLHAASNDSNGAGSNLQRPPLSFTLAEAQKALARRGEVPLTLETVLCEMLDAGELRRVDHFAAASEARHITGTARSSVASRVTSYLWSWLVPKKRATTRLPPGRYVLLDEVDEAARELLQQLPRAETDIFTLEQMQAMTHRPMPDVLLLVHHLQLLDEPLYEAFPASIENGRVTSLAPNAASSSTSLRVFKYGSRATVVDHARATLALTLKQLRERAKEKEKYVDERDREARRLLLEKRKPLALIQLQMKKRCLSQLHALHSQCENVDLVLAHLEQSNSQQEYLTAMRQANDALKQVRATSPEDVREVTDELSEQLSRVQLADEALAAPMAGTDDETAALEAEYDAMLHEIEDDAKAKEDQTTTATAPPVAATTTPSIKHSESQPAAIVLS